MTYFSALLALLLAQPAFYLETPDDTRSARLTMVAEELVRYPRQIAVAAIVQGQAESGFARYVWEGCKLIPDKAPDCDHSRARGYFQLWRDRCVEAYRYAPGTRESLREELACFARHWKGNRQRCAAQGVHPDEAGFSGFAGGYWCTWRGAKRRAESYRAALTKFQKLKPRREG